MARASPFCRSTYPRHPPINHKVGPVHKAALVAGQEQNGLSLLYGFAEAAGWEVDLAAVALGGIVPEPVLKQRRAKDGSKRQRSHGIDDGILSIDGRDRSLLQRSWAQRVKSKPFLRMHNRQLPRHCQHGAFARRVRQLRRRTPHQRDHARCIDDTTDLLLVPTHAEHSMLAAVPHPLDVDVVRQIPDLFRRIDSVSVVAVHDAGVVENDVDAAPGVEMFDHGFDVGFFGHVALDGLDSGRVRGYGADFGEGGGEGGFGYVRHEDGGAFAGEKDGRFQADAARKGVEVSMSGNQNLKSFWKK